MHIESMSLNVSKSDDGIYYNSNSIEVFYPEDGNTSCFQIEENSFWFRHRNDLISETVKRFGGGETFFDVGGGNGFVSRRLQDEGYPVVLIEPGRRGATNARFRGVETVICSTLQEAGFTENQLGAVGLFDVVEHIEDDRGFLKDIMTFMKPGGHLFITVPAYNFLWSNEDDDAQHFRRYTCTTMNQLLQNQGFELVYDTYIFSILPLPIFLLRSLPSKLGLNKNSSETSKHQKDHNPSVGVFSALLDNIWSWERSRVTSGKRLGFGGSCLVVVKKPDSGP